MIRKLLSFIGRLPRLPLIEGMVQDVNLVLECQNDKSRKKVLPRRMSGIIEGTVQCYVRVCVIVFVDEKEREKEIMEGRHI